LLVLVAISILFFLAPCTKDTTPDLTPIYESFSTVAPTVILTEQSTETGVIVVRAPSLTSGYYKDPESKVESWAGSWMHTGDGPSVNENNSIQIVDHIKDVIKSGGQ
jgi:fatty-acyl-CoA synthase